MIDGTVLGFREGQGEKPKEFTFLGMTFTMFFRLK